MPGDRPGGSPPLPPPISGLPKHDERRDAAAAEYQRQLASLELDALDELDDAPTPVAPITLPSYPKADAPARKPAQAETSEVRSNLEPIPEAAHPPQNRRIPTQPPMALALDVESHVGPSSGNEASSEPSKPLPPPKAHSRQSPSPVRRGLFSIDRITNLLAGAAVGLLLAVYPAKKLAESYETRVLEPRLSDLDASVEQTLAVDADLVQSPEAIAAEIEAGRKRVRRRFSLIWLFAGLPIGIALGLKKR